MRSNKGLIPFMISIAFMAAFVGLLSLAYTTPESDTEKTNAPTSLIGEWKQTNSEATGFRMSASISASSIQVDMRTRDGSSIYWLGTFDTSKNPAHPFEIVSKGDPDAMSMSIFGSQDKYKSFTYKNGELSYQFSMMGATNTVRLVKTTN